MFLSHDRGPPTHLLAQARLKRPIPGGCFQTRRTRVEGARFGSAAIQAYFSMLQFEQQGPGRGFGAILACSRSEAPDPSGAFLASEFAHFSRTTDKFAVR